LLIKGEKSQAQVYLDKAFNFADNHQSLLSELWFYRLAHYPDYRQQEQIKGLNWLRPRNFKELDRSNTPLFEAMGAFVKIYIK
jgi:hypothetical protein